MNLPILGIDVSKESLDVCLIIENQSNDAVFDNNHTGHK